MVIIRCFLPSQNIGSCPFTFPLVNRQLPVFWSGNLGQVQGLPRIRACQSIHPSVCTSFGNSEEQVPEALLHAYFCGRSELLGNSVISFFSKLFPSSILISPLFPANLWSVACLYEDRRGSEWIRVWDHPAHSGWLFICWPEYILIGFCDWEWTDN